MEKGAEGEAVRCPVMQVEYDCGEWIPAGRIVGLDGGDVAYGCLNGGQQRLYGGRILS